MRIAIDVNILLHSAPRRFLMGAVVLAGAGIVVPEAAARVARERQPWIRRRDSARQVTRDTVRQEPEPDPTEEAGLILERMRQAGDGFAAWLEDEPTRNDGAFTIALQSRASEQTAIELWQFGVVDEDWEPNRWGTGSDPHVLAEALEAGAHWASTGNVTTLDAYVMEEWLDRAQADGRYLQVSRPFVLDGEETIALGLGEGSGPDREDLATKHRCRLALANALCRPASLGEDPRERLQVLARFAKSVRKAGFRHTGLELERWSEQRRFEIRNGHATASDLGAELDRLDRELAATEVARIRDAEDRRRRLEQDSLDKKPSESDVRG